MSAIALLLAALLSVGSLSAVKAPRLAIHEPAKSTVEQAVATEAEQVNRTLDAGNPVLIYFYVPGDPRCRKQTQLLRQGFAQGEYPDMTVLWLDPNVQKEAAEQMGVKASDVPVLFILTPAREIIARDKGAGLYTIEDIATMVMLGRTVPIPTELKK